MCAQRSVLPPKIGVLGVKISYADLSQTIESIIEAVRSSRAIVVSSLAVHGLMLARGSIAYRQVVHSLDIAAADGHPVRWLLGRAAGKPLSERVSGTDLMERLCARCESEGFKIYLYGSTADVITRLQARLRVKFPRLAIAGWEPSVFRPLAPEEAADLVKRINSSGASIVFVGLGCPLQETFACAHRQQIRAVQVCAGAAFDFLSGNKRRAPRYMQRAWLEWLHRWIFEPKRLTWRYLSTNSAFIFAVIMTFIRRAKD